MRHLVTGTGRYLTSDTVADGVMDLAAALTEAGRTEAVELPYLEEDLMCSVCLLVGAGVTVTAVSHDAPHHPGFAVPRDAVAGSLRARADAIRNPSADEGFTPEEIEPLGDPGDW